MMLGENFLDEIPYNGVNLTVLLIYLVYLHGWHQILISHVLTRVDRESMFVQAKLMHLI